MGNAQILIHNGSYWYEFSKSKTGQLDYVGPCNFEDEPKMEGYQRIASSTYLTPSYYLYFQEILDSSHPMVYVSQETDISNKDEFAFLTHVGPLLMAVDVCDSLLAGELYLRRQSIFDSFAPLTQYIMQPICAEILFSLVYGKIDNSKVEDIPLIFNIAKKKLGYEPSKETLDQAYIRYFKENRVYVSLETVGTNHHHWKPYSRYLDNMATNLNPEDLLRQTDKIREAKHSFYGSLSVEVQAEPYNPADENAISVLIENIDAKITGYRGLQKAGYIRALAAKILREAKPEKLSYDGSLCRLRAKDVIVMLHI